MSEADDGARDPEEIDPNGHIVSTETDSEISVEVAVACPNCGAETRMPDPRLRDETEMRCYDCDSRVAWWVEDDTLYCIYDPDMDYQQSWGSSDDVDRDRDDLVTSLPYPVTPDHIDALRDSEKVREAELIFAVTRYSESPDPVVQLFVLETDASAYAIVEHPERDRYRVLMQGDRDLVDSAIDRWHSLFGNP